MFTQSLLTTTSLHDRLRAFGAAWFALVMLSAVSVAQADDNGAFFVRDAHAWHDEEGWFLDAQCEIRLSGGALEALENGVPLVFELRVQIVRQHRWLWDAVEYEREQVRQLQYHALTRSYLVKDLNSGGQGVYSQLDDALYAAGLIDAMLLTDDPLDSKHDYMVRLRGSHDIESLPTPVRLLAYVSSEWNMNSEWYSWPLAR